jgi:hypothetical protein
MMILDYARIDIIDYYINSTCIIRKSKDFIISQHGIFTLESSLI